MLEEFYNRMTGGEVIATVFERAESQVFNTVLVYIIFFYSIQLKLDPIPTDMGGGAPGISVLRLIHFWKKLQNYETTSMQKT